MVSPKTRFDVFKRDGFTCQYCGRKSPEVILEVDHIIPHSKNGTDDEGNLITSCRLCNRQKSNNEIVENLYTKDQKEVTSIDYTPCIITIEFKSKLYNKKIEINPDHVFKDIPDVTNLEKFFYNVLYFMHMGSFGDTTRFLGIMDEICESDISKNIFNIPKIRFENGDNESGISMKTDEINLEIWRKICDIDKRARHKKDIHESKKRR